MATRRSKRSSRAQSPTFPRNSTPINTNILDTENVYQEQEEPEEKGFRESETRGSEHPSHLEEHQWEDEIEGSLDQFLPKQGTTAQAIIENWRTPLELSDQRFEQD
jgi:hypothetical protein